jgi:hypothetical protein
VHTINGNADEKATTDGGDEYEAHLPMSELMIDFSSSSAELPKTEGYPIWGGIDFILIVFIRLIGDAERD